MSSTRAKPLLFTLVLAVAVACAPRLQGPVSRPAQALREVLAARVPLEEDDMEQSSLMQAISNSLGYYERLPATTLFSFGSRRVPVARAKRSLEVFLHLLAETNSWEELAARVRQRFILYQSIGSGSEHQVLFTGYYEPTIQGSLTRDEHYRFPIYGVPDDLLKIDLGRFRPQYQGVQLVGRCQGKQVVPYYRRKEIDSDGRLAGKGGELAWVADPVAIFFLQIQGSGRIRLLNGDYLRVGYAASNGWPYRSIGKFLVAQKQLPRQAVSMQAIRAYLRSHPDERAEILNHNQSYVFFRVVKEGPLGSLGVPITAGRSIATDFRLFPPGALAFIECQKPVFARDGVIIGWKTFHRYVVNQDSGGAIRGPDRVDLFWGSGPFSRIAAGHLKHQGALYFLLLKQ